VQLVLYLNKLFPQIFFLLDFAFVSDRTGLGRKEGRNQNFFISPNNIKFQEVGEGQKTQSIFS
jgi:hypothetical protein